jgi:hypothetical protein
MKKLLKKFAVVIIVFAWLLPFLPVPVFADTTLFTETCASNPTQPLNTSTTDGGVNTWSAEIAIDGANAITLNSGTTNCSATGATTDGGVAHTMSTSPTTNTYYVRTNLIDGGTVAATASHGVIVNYIDTSNYYACHYADDAAASTLDVYILKVTGGVGSTLGTASNVASMASGETVECRIHYSGTTPTITITNITDNPDTEYLTATDSSSPLTETRTAGVYCGAVAARTGDDCATVQDMDEINLVEVTVTPTVTTQDASGIGATSATFNGNITATGGDGPTVRGFAWGTVSTLSGGDTATTTDTTGQPFSAGAFTESGQTLVCNTTYYYRAYATNSIGTGYGAISNSFTTSACGGGSLSVNTNAETNVTTGSGTINGEITATGGENATVRGFAWGTDSGLATVMGTTTESGDFGTGTFSQNLSGLISGVTYYFRAYATNPSGTAFGSIDNLVTGTNNTPNRRIRLFEGYTIKILEGGTMIIR